MAIETTNKDISTRGVTNTTLAQFAGRARQVVINIDDGFRPIVMDGSTLGGKFKVASLADIQTALDDYEPSGNFLTVEDAAATYATKSEVTSSLAGKANTSHTHAQSDVTGLSDALAGKANTAHSHNQSDVVGLDTALAGKAAASHTHTKAEVTDFAHTHATNEVTGLDTALAAKADSSALTSLIPKAGARGLLAGYEKQTRTSGATVNIGYSTGDTITHDAIGQTALTVNVDGNNIADLDNACVVKILFMYNTTAVTSLNVVGTNGITAIDWEGEGVPSLSGKGVLRLVLMLHDFTASVSLKQW